MFGWVLERSRPLYVCVILGSPFGISGSLSGPPWGLRPGPPAVSLAEHARRELFTRFPCGDLEIRPSDLPGEKQKQKPSCMRLSSTEERQIPQWKHGSTPWIRSQAVRSKEDSFTKNLPWLAETQRLNAEKNLEEENRPA